MKKSFAEASEGKITLLHELGQNIDLIAEFERTPGGLLAGIQQYYEYMKSAIEKHGIDSGQFFLVIFDFSFSDDEIDFIVKDEELKIRRAGAYINQYESLSVLRPFLTADYIYP